MAQNIVTLTSLLCGDPIEPGAKDWRASLQASEVHRLVRYLGPFAAENRPPLPGKILNVHRLDVARGLVIGAAQLLDASQGGLHKVMAALQATGPQSPSVRRSFSPLYRVLYDNLADPCFQFLRDGFEDYLHEHWWGLVCRRNKRMQEGTVFAHPRLTLPQMAKAASVPPSVVRHMVQAEFVPAVSAQTLSGRHSRSIHLDELPRIKAAVDGALTLEQAARALALPERRVRDLINDGLIHPLISRQKNREASAWLIPKDQINRLFIRTTLGPRTPGKITVRDVLKYWRLRDREGSALITAVIDGDLSAEGRGHILPPIGTAVLSAPDAKQWLVKHRDKSSVGLSVDSAAKVLGLKQQVVYDLVRLGLLNTNTASTLGHRIRPEDIERFRTTYVSLASLAKSVRRSPRSLLGEVAAPPVCGPDINGSRQYFYRRSELEAQWLAMLAA